MAIYTVWAHDPTEISDYVDSTHPNQTDARARARDLWSDGIYSYTEDQDGVRVWHPGDDDPVDPISRGAHLAMGG